MTAKKSKFAKLRAANPIAVAILVALVITVSGVGTLRFWYSQNLRPVSSSTATNYFTVEPGSSVHQIAVQLQRAKLIRSTQAFETYVRSNELHDRLQAGTYILSQSMNTHQIIKKMTSGDVAKNLLTILPGKRLDQIEQAFTKAGYSQAEIKAAFSPAQYKSHLALASLPTGASLEGYLYPDSFQKQTNTPASTIVGESLDEMQSNLTTPLTTAFAAKGLSIYQAITLASIIYQESGDPVYQPTVAQVFLSRLAASMPLGSDVTAFYASAVIGTTPNVNISSPYNTRINSGLPPGPIGNVTVDALQAVAHPASSDYLYFVAGDDGTLHFSHTEAQHQQDIAKYCTKQCS